MSGWQVLAGLAAVALLAGCSEAPAIEPTLPESVRVQALHLAWNDATDRQNLTLALEPARVVDVTVFVNATRAPYVVMPATGTGTRYVGDIGALVELAGGLDLWCGVNSPVGNPGVRCTASQRQHKSAESVRLEIFGKGEGLTAEVVVRTLPLVRSA